MRQLRRALAAIAVAIVLLAGIDAIVRLVLPHSVRLSDNFSATYLRREVDALRGTAPIVVLGDSALWGYGLPADRAAVTLLQRSGVPLENFSYEGGSPPNTYAMLRVLIAGGIRPRLLIFNVNQKEFNPADSAYQQLHPSVERLAWTILTPAERALLKPTQRNGPDDRLQRAVESIWQLYGVRADVREMLFHDVDAIHALQTAVERLSGHSEERARTGEASCNSRKLVRRARDDLRRLAESRRQGLKALALVFGSDQGDRDAES
jgi:hypothetical protein